MRYVLDIPFGDKAGDQKYKQELVGFTMGSGGKVVLHAVDRYGQSYQIRRVWKENNWQTPGRLYQVSAACEL